MSQEVLNILRRPRAQETLYEVSDQQGRSFRGILTNYNEQNGTATFLFAQLGPDGNFIVNATPDGDQVDPFTVNLADIHRIRPVIPSILSQKSKRNDTDNNYSKKQGFGGTKRRKYKRKSVRRKRTKRTRRVKR
jgi:hypothetical protein